MKIDKVSRFRFYFPKEHKRFSIEVRLFPIHIGIVINGTKEYGYGFDLELLFVAFHFETKGTMK